MRRAASRLLSYFLVRLSLLVTSMAVLPAPYYQIPRFSGDTLTTGPGLSGFWSVPGGSEVIHMPDKRGYRKLDVLGRDMSGYATYQDLGNQSSRKCNAK